MFSREIFEILKSTYFEGFLRKTASSNTVCKDKGKGRHYRGVFRIQSNIYDGAFFAKIVNGL